MPANLTPEYKAAESEFRRAREPADRLHWLKEMLRTIPKHKGTDHLQADIKTRIKELTEDLAGPKRSGARSGPPTVIRPEGAAQVALLGPPNAGKSALHHRLTGSHAPAGPGPYETQFPLPGMFPFEDIAFQLIDLPSLGNEHAIPWIGNALQPADAAWLVVDPTDPACVEGVAYILDTLAARRIHLVPGWPLSGPAFPLEDPFVRQLSTLLVGAKAELLSNPVEEIETLKELGELPFPVLPVSAETGLGLDRLGPFLFEHLGVVRVYTKVPGRPPDLTRPYTLRRGDTVVELAEMVHKEIATGLKYARLWVDGHARQIGRDHPLADGDVVELHA